jgi:ribosomal protein S5
MSANKFNGFEKYFIQTALRHAIEEAEENIIELEREGKRSIYAPGYFTMVGNEIIHKVNRMTLKKHQD